MGTTEDTIRKLLIDRFFPGEDPSNLGDTTPLLTSRVLDSVSVLTLIELLEKEFGVVFDSRDVTADVLDTIAEMAALIRRKLEA